MFEVRHDPEHRGFDVYVSSDDARVLYRVLARVTHVLDLDADPAAIATVLGRDPRLAASVRRQPGSASAGRMGWIRNCRPRHRRTAGIGGWRADAAGPDG